MLSLADRELSDRFDFLQQIEWLKACQHICPPIYTDE